MAGLLRSTLQHDCQPTKHICGPVVSPPGDPGWGGREAPPGPGCCAEGTQSQRGGCTRGRDPGQAPFPGEEGQEEKGKEPPCFWASAHLKNLFGAGIFMILWEPGT